MGAAFQVVLGNGTGKPQDEAAILGSFIFFDTRGEALGEGKGFPGFQAAGLVGQEGLVLNKTAKYALILLGMGIAFMLIMAYFFPEYFPQIIEL